MIVPLVVAALLATAASAAGVVDEPECYSTTPAFVDRELQLQVQPSDPILIQRYQAPEIRLFCISFEEAGPTCGAASVPQLCSRPVAGSSAFTCESLSMFVGDATNSIARGDINGEDMIWDLMWDGTASPTSCFPRAVRIRALALVRDASVTSVLLLVVLSLVVFLALLLIAAGIFYFLRDRFAVIDRAGAVTIGGPKPTYQGPQMGVAPPAGSKDEPTVFLPVRTDHGATQDINAAEYTDPAIAAARATGLASRGPAPRRLKEAPAPGDGLPDDHAVRAGIQRSLGLEPDMVDGRRRRRSGPGGPGFSDGDDDIFSAVAAGPQGYRTRGALFPTAAGLEVDEDEAFDYAPPALGRNGVPIPTDDEDDILRNERGLPVFAPEDFDEATGQPRPGARPLRRNGQRRAPTMPEGEEAGVRYVPQWMQGSFGRGGLIPESGDGPAMMDLDPAPTPTRHNAPARYTPRGPGQETPRSAMRRPAASRPQQATPQPAADSFDRSHRGSALR